MPDAAITPGYIFTADWFSHNIPHLEQWLAPLAGKPGIQGLEVGSHQGRSTIWLLEHVFTSPDSRLYCVDTFEGSVEHTDIHKTNLFEIFQHNLQVSGNLERVSVMRGPSQTVLRTIERKPYFDFIYIDGDHHANAVLEDAVLCFSLLKDSGILVFDDYGWVGMPHEWQRPKIAIEGFFHAMGAHLELLGTSHQVAFRKKTPVADV